jgi:DNA-directed RNA polymerase subunit RPC12/RpoP
MITMLYECPETHAPLPRISTAIWLASDTSELAAIHCPHCSRRHTFSRADAILCIQTPVPMASPEPEPTPRYSISVRRTAEPAGSFR